MDNAILKKRLNTFKSGSGKLRKVNDDVVMEVLRAWENWPGSAADLYRELGLSKMQLVILLKNGKRLVKSGIVSETEFREIALNVSPASPSLSSCQGIELSLDKGQVLRFYQVDQLLDFLKRVA